MKTRDQIIAEHPIESVLSERGINLIGSGRERKCKCPFHEDGSPSFGVNVDEQVWHCYAGCGGGSVIDLLAKFENCSPQAILKKYGDGETNGWTPPKPKPQEKPEPKQQASDKASDKPKAVAFYDYRDAKGELIYQAVRLEPKSFRQRRPAGDGKWFWDMKDVERVLYNLPKVLKSTTPIWVVEGEKDADNIGKLGITATCNVGGAGKWLDAYTDSLKGKDIVLCGDNDKPGKEHMDKVFESLGGKVKSIRWVKVPEPDKDISDYLAKQVDKVHAIEKLFSNAPVFDKGLNIPIKSMAECEEEMIRAIQKSDKASFDFKHWLPSLGKVVRPLVGGEVCTIIAGTKVGKTALAQNIVMAAKPLKTVYFSMELPESLMAERCISMATKTPSKEVYITYKKGGYVDWRSTGNLDHVFICPKTKLTAQAIEDLLIQAELKIGEPPALAVIDYIQLMGGKGERRERIADAAEGIKAVAKNRDIIIILISQIHRKGKDSDKEVGLFDGKEAGEIENSSGLVLGAWRESEEANSPLHLKVLANTKGFSGKDVVCNFEGEIMTITEMEENPVADEDVPKQTPYEKTAASSPYSDH